MIVKLLTEHHLEFLSLKGGCTGSSESPLVKMSNCWKSRALAHITLINHCKTGLKKTFSVVRQAVIKTSHLVTLAVTIIYCRKMPL